MSGVVKNSALNVKIHGKLKGKLNREMYKRMTNFKTVPEVAQFLKAETNWGSVLENVETEGIHRGFLEEILGRGINQDIKALTAFTDISETAFMKLFAIREEIENLKVFLRLLCSGHSERFVPAVMVFEKSEIDFSALSKVKNFEELMTLIDKAPCAVALKGFAQYKERQNIFDFENALDLYYCRLIFKYAKKNLSQAEYKVVRETYGSEMDLATIMFIIRARQSFDFPKEELYPYVRHKFAHLNDGIVREMIEAGSRDEIYEIIRKTKYSGIFVDGDDFPERRINKYLYDLHKKMFRRGRYSVEAVLYYIKIRETEFRNIVTIIEGIRYGLEPKTIQSYIIGL